MFRNKHLASGFNFKKCRKIYLSDALLCSTRNLGEQYRKSRSTTKGTGEESSWKLASVDVTLRGRITESSLYVDACESNERIIRSEAIIASPYHVTSNYCHVEIIISFCCNDILAILRNRLAYLLWIFIAIITISD